MFAASQIRFKILTLCWNGRNTNFSRLQQRLVVCTIYPLVSTSSNEDINFHTFDALIVNLFDIYYGNQYQQSLNSAVQRTLYFPQQFY